MWRCRLRAGVANWRIASGVAAPLCASLVAVASITLVTPGRAEALTDVNQQKYGWREVWGGADATKDVWLLYTGVTLAPLSNDVYSDGLRFRVNSGYGQYQFKGRDIACNASKAFDCAKRIEVDVTYTDALIGYHLRLGELTAKAFAGASFISHDFGRNVTNKAVQGLDIGVTGGLEFWLNLGRDGWTSLDLQYTTAHDTGSARWRAGWRIMPTVSIGPEARYDSDTSSKTGRLGLFARHEWTGGEISAATGVAQKICAFGDILCDGDDDAEIAPYVTINVLSQF